MPLLVVSDIAISRKFYEDILDQKTTMDFGANITFEGGFSLQSKESWVNFIHKTENEVLSKPDNFELYFEEEQFDEFVERLKLFKITYLHNVVEYPWAKE